MDHMCTISFHMYSFPVPPLAIHLIYNDGSQAALTWRPPRSWLPRPSFLLLCKLWPDSRDRSDLRAEPAVSPVNPAETSWRDKPRISATSSLYRLLASHRTFTVQDDEISWNNVLQCQKVPVLMQMRAAGGNASIALAWIMNLGNI